MSKNCQHNGMTLRQYAAIKLRVPDSGTDWLDKMILKSLRDEMAGKALQGMLSSPPIGADRNPDTLNHAGWARQAYLFANALLHERNKT